MDVERWASLWRCLGDDYGSKVEVVLIAFQYPPFLARLIVESLQRIHRNNVLRVALLILIHDHNSLSPRILTRWLPAANSNFHLALFGSLALFRGGSRSSGSGPRLAGAGVDVFPPGLDGGTVEGFAVADEVNVLRQGEALDAHGHN